MSLPRLLLAVVLGLPAPAARAETFHTCAGFIASLPATIATQGTWCLDKDLSTPMTSGAAITVAANNVTIDCNGYKLGGLSAGDGTAARGISATGRLNTTVRHCSIRGFQIGIQLTGSGSGGHLVADNRLDNNTQTGIYVRGDGSEVRGNAVFDTGGSTSALGFAKGIETQDAVDVRDNTVSGVLPTPLDGVAYAYGIHTTENVQGEIRGNRIRGLVSAGIGSALGIYNNLAETLTIRDNVVHGDWSDGSVGIRCTDALSRAIGNVQYRFDTPIENCTSLDNSD